MFYLLQKRKEPTHCDNKLTCQVGQDKGGLPIGLQFIGRPWSEATLLHIAFAMQARFNFLSKDTTKCGILAPFFLPNPEKK